MIKVAIQHVCDFLSRARLPDLVQGPPHVFVEAIRVWNLAHLGFLGLESQPVEWCRFLCEWNGNPRAIGYTELAGINWRISLRIVSGSCSRAGPAKV